MSARLVRWMNVRWALTGSAVAAVYLSRFAAYLCHAHEMTDCSGFQLKKFRQRSRLPFHSSSLRMTLFRVRQVICLMTVRLGRSSQMTVSARAQTIGLTD